MPIKVQGVDGATNKLGAIGNRMDSELYRTVKDIGDDLKDASQQRVSVQSGALRDSAYSRPDRSQNGSSVDVGYEGLPYIIPHHEGHWENFLGQYGHLDMNYPGGGEPKWFEKEWLERKEADKVRIREAVRKGLGT